MVFIIRLVPMGIVPLDNLLIVDYVDLVSITISLELGLEAGESFEARVFKELNLFEVDLADYLGCARSLRLREAHLLYIARFGLRKLHKVFLAVLSNLLNELPERLFVASNFLW